MRLQNKIKGLETKLTPTTLVEVESSMSTSMARGGSDLYPT